MVWSTTLCSTLVYSCSFVLVTVARIYIGLVSFGLSCLDLFCLRALSCLFWSVLAGLRPCVAGLEYSASVWWAGLVVVWWVLSGCVCVCLQDSQVWRGLTCQAQSRTQAVVHLTLLKVSRGQTAADCRDHFSCNACIVELAGSCLHA